MGNLSDFFKATADILHTASGNLKKNKFTSAIIVAGGSSLRIGGDKSKQMLLICDIPVVVHTLLAFQNCERISEIIVVAKENEIPLYEDFAKKYCITKLKNTVKGGDTRQKSALCGFNAISPESDYVAIHDAARCLITSEDICRVLDAAIKYGAASASVSVSDTVKIVDKNNFIIRTEDRHYVKLSQTPQIFSRNLYCAAAYTAKEESFEATDDNLLVERIGYKVKMVDCGSENIKITFPEDIKRVEKIIEERKRDQV